MVKRIFGYVFAGLVRPLQALGASRCSPKNRIGSNRDIVLLEHIFDQVKLIFIVLLVGLIYMKAAVDFKNCLFFVYR